MTAGTATMAAPASAQSRRGPDGRAA